LPYSSRIGCVDVVLQEVTKPDVSRRFGYNVLMCDEEVLKILGQGRRQVGLLECSKEQDLKVFRYVGVCGVRTGERHIRRDGRRK